MIKLFNQYISENYSNSNFVPERNENLSSEDERLISDKFHDFFKSESKLNSFVLQNRMKVINIEQGQRIQFRMELKKPIRKDLVKDFISDSVDLFNEFLTKTFKHSTKGKYLLTDDALYLTVDHFRLKD